MSKKFFQTLSVLTLMCFSLFSFSAMAMDDEEHNHALTQRLRTGENGVVANLFYDGVSPEETAQALVESMQLQSRLEDPSENSNILIPLSINIEKDNYNITCDEDISEYFFSIGRKYCPSDNTNLYHEEGLKCYLKAADKNHANAQAHIGIIYQNGQGVQTDYEKALEWHLKAALQNNIHAQFHLGLMYFNGGFGLNKDEEESKKWYKKAHAQGHPIDETIIRYFGL